MAKLILYQAKSPYPGDITKNCALTGKEVDNNFLNLKGEDIKRIYLDEETKKLTFVRYKHGLKNCNGETVEAEIEIDLKELEYVTGYEYDNGEIKITYSNGKTSQMPIEAFGLAVATDHTINGNGVKSRPLSIAQSLRTGQYQPVSGIIDTVEGESLPKHVHNGEGYVTRETKSNFGMFYSLSQVKQLQEILSIENSEWRVPTKQDWDTLLNYLEECDRYKNHSLRSESELDAQGMKLGNLAGFKAKSRDTDEYNYWNRGGEYNGNVLRIYPAGSFPVLSAVAGGYGGFGDYGHFWTSTVGDFSCTNYYSKKFIDCVGTVTQIEELPDTKLSIRLVKDFTGDNYRKFEEIHGRVYETRLFASDSDECNQVWTMVNIDIQDVNWHLAPTPIPEDATTAVTKENAYYINRWDGYKWDKHEMVEGDCVVIVSNKKAYDDAERIDEYRLERGDDGQLYLVNIDEFWQNQIDAISSAATGSTEYLQEQIDELSGTTNEIKSDIGNLWDEIANEESARTESDSVLQSNIDSLSDRINGLDEEIGKINNRIGNVNDIPEKAAVEYTPDDFNERRVTVFGFINASNDYGYNLEDNN